MQQRLLPRVLPQPVGWELAVHRAAGRWPGGDYYDFISLPDGRLLVLVADASDQGAPSSALIAMVRVVLHSCPLSTGSEQLPFCPLHEPITQPPHILLGHLNRILVENSLEEQYLTAFCGVLDPLEGNFHYANAGHPYPRWWHAANRTVEGIRDAGGQPLGIDAHTTYHHRRIQLARGDILVFYTDGLTASQNARGEMFGCEPLDAAIARSADQGAEAVKVEVVAMLNDFQGRDDPQDDVTLVVVERVA
jgi:sigma-B regulation protein RsbU (phosphoserine phosphatase)